MSLNLPSQYEQRVTVWNILRNVTCEKAENHIVQPASEVDLYLFLYVYGIRRNDIWPFLLKDDYSETPSACL